MAGIASPDFGKSMKGLQDQDELPGLFQDLLVKEIENPQHMMNHQNRIDEWKAAELTWVRALLMAGGRSASFQHSLFHALCPCNIREGEAAIAS